MAHRFFDALFASFGPDIYMQGKCSKFWSQSQVNKAQLLMYNWFFIELGLIFTELLVR